MHIADTNKLDWLEGAVFADGLIQDRGYFDVRIDLTKDSPKAPSLCAWFF